jgi:hypothetical protein
MATLVPSQSEPEKTSLNPPVETGKVEQESKSSREVRFMQPLLAKIEIISEHV